MDHVLGRADLFENQVLRVVWLDMASVGPKDLLGDAQEEVAVELRMFFTERELCDVWVHTCGLDPRLNGFAGLLWGLRFGAGELVRQLDVGLWVFFGSAVGSEDLISPGMSNRLVCDEVPIFAEYFLLVGSKWTVTS
jgi:hypothetical protein